jgi:SH3 domain protein
MRPMGVILLVLVSLTNVAFAQQRYVTDELVITFRTGPSAQNAIIRNLSSGAALTILEERADVGYARVRAANGDEGWVLTQYLENEPGGDQLHEAAERELAQSRDRMAELEAQLQDVSGSFESASSELNSSRETGVRLSSELENIREASASAIELRDQNESLRRRVSELSAQVDVVAIENNQLRSRSTQNWFVVGAAVLFGGFILGLVAPSLRPRKKSSW